MPKDYTAADIVQMIRAKYSDPQRFVVCEEVNAGTGSLGRSWVDVGVIALWPSDGCSRYAFEVKVSRQDWLREQQNHEKNSWVWDCFHNFSYVAPKDVIKEQELPDGAGLFIPRGNGLTCVRSPKQNKKAKSDDMFMASIARSIQKEFDRKKDDLKKHVLENDWEVRTALAWVKVVEKFLRDRGVVHYFTNEAKQTKDEMVEEGIKKLEEATADKKVKKDIDQVNEIAEAFRKDMCDLFKRFASLAYVSISEVDQAGDRILQQYGIHQDGVVFQRLEKDLTERGSYSKESTKKELAWMKLLLVKGRENVENKV